MLTACLPTVRVSGVSTGGGEVGPQVNEFEQVSSDDHQMSVEGVGPMSSIQRSEEGGYHVWYQGGRGGIVTGFPLFRADKIP